MTSVASKPPIETSATPASTGQTRLPRHFKVIETTYKNNVESDYTERIEELTRQFDYARDGSALWGDPQLSIFYGTPLYEQASESQRRALNHLYWVAQYTHTANAEANTILYNRVTSGVFAHFSEYRALCEELDFESEQEFTHIRAFQKIGLKTKAALMGKEALRSPSTGRGKKFVPKGKQPWQSKLASSATSFSELAFRASNRAAHWEKRWCYSQYLQQNAKDSIPVSTGGLAGVTASPAAFKYLTLSWGSSPFLAAQYYSARMIANMSLKAYEHSYFKRFRTLQKAGEFVPNPTAISHYHMLDESYHTTLSQLISQELYRDFAKPSAYEKILSDSIVRRLQRGLLGGLSGGMMVVFRDDEPFLDFYYRLLQSKVFGMSAKDALYWMERILCQEHEGYHANAKHHRSLLVAFQRFFGKLDYLSPINREMQLMSRGADIEAALASNRNSLRSFRQKVA